MANCTRRMWGDRDGLPCALSAGHGPGHVYAASGAAAAVPLLRATGDQPAAE